MSQYKEMDSNSMELKKSAYEAPASKSSSLYCLHGQIDVQLRDHCHRQRTDGIDVKARKKLIIASVLCLFFMTCEIVGGVLSNSLAIATDAAHLLTDFASFMISLFAIWIAGRPSTQRMSFGWYRAEVIGALASVFMIWVITAILIWLAIQRIINQEYDLDATIMLITSGLAILVNLIMGLQLHVGHSHGGKTPTTDIPAPTSENNVAQTSNGVELGQETKPKKKVKAQPTENINVRAAYIHVLGDALSSVGVFIAALIIYFKPEWAIADPICTFIFSVIVLFTTFNIMKDALLVLMEGTPSYLHYAEVMDVFLQIDGVERVHNLRIWALSINKVSLSAHLAIKPGTNPTEILQVANRAVHLKYNFFETTIQIEDFIPEMEDCTMCLTPDR